jgi:hypothetical protein
MRISLTPATLIRAAMMLGWAVLLAGVSALVIRWLDPTLLNNLKQETPIFGLSRTLILIVLLVAVALGLGELLRQDFLSRTLLVTRVLSVAAFFCYAAFFAALLVAGLDKFIGNGGVVINRGLSGIALGALGVGLNAAAARYTALIASNPADTSPRALIMGVLLADLRVAFIADLLALIIIGRIPLPFIVAMPVASLLSFVAAVLAVAGFVAATNARPAVAPATENAAMEPVAVAAGSTEETAQ